MLIDTDGKERYPNYGQAGLAECYIAYLELIGEPVTDYERQALERERTGKNLSVTAEEIAASHQREWEKWISEWDDILSTYEKLRLKEVIERRGGSLWKSFHRRPKPRSCHQSDSSLSTLTPARLAEAKASASSSEMYGP